MCKCLMKLIWLCNVCDAFKCDGVVVAAGSFQASLYLCACWKKSIRLHTKVTYRIWSTHFFSRLNRIGMCVYAYAKQQMVQKIWRKSVKNEESRIWDEERTRKPQLRFKKRNKKRFVIFKHIHQNFRFGYLN